MNLISRCVGGELNRRIASRMCGAKMRTSGPKRARPSFLLELLHNVTNEPSAIDTMSSSPQTSIPHSNFKLILDATLSEYKKKTGKELLDHPIATELQRCDTVDAVLAILQDQAGAFQQLEDDQRLMKWIGPLAQVLFAFSGTLGEGDVGQVLRRSPIRGDQSAF